MSNAYRMDQIYTLLLRKGSATVTELAEQFQVTPTTIRRDLLEMEERNMIYRTRGSAFLRGSGYADSASRVNVFAEEKKRIAAAAAKFISTGMSIALDSGSTVSTLAAQLIGDESLGNIDFITHSPEIALQISKRFNVSIPGGSITPNNEFMVGVEVEEFYKKINVDISFLGSTGVFNCSGLTVSYPLQLPVKKYSALCGDKRVALLDSSKYTRRGIYVFCEFSELDTLITVETEENKPQLERIAKQGVDIILV